MNPVCGSIPHQSHWSATTVLRNTKMRVLYAKLKSVSRRVVETWLENIKKSTSGGSLPRVVRFHTNHIHGRLKRGGLLVWSNGNEKLSTGQLNIRPADGTTHYRVGSVVTCNTLSMATLAQQRTTAIVTWSVGWLIRRNMSVALRSMALLIYNRKENIAKMKVKDKWKRGLPYVGNKGQKVEQIMEALPDGKRLVDVFGGGGCVSLTAVSSGKYEEVIYNDRRKTVVELLRALVSDETHFNLMDYVALTREQFFDWRDNQPDSIERTLVLTAYSFSNNQKDYLWGRKKEEEKLLLTKALFYGNTGTEFDQLYSYSLNANTISEKYRLFHKWRLEQMNINSRYDLLQRLQRLQQLQQLQRLEQLQQLQRLQQLEQLEYSVKDYRELVIDADDVVYCDPPYVGTQYDYDGFDHKAFENWYLHECPAKEIYISEYTKLPHTEVAFNFGNKQNFSATGKRRDELLLRVVH